MSDLVEKYFDGAAALYNDATSTDEQWSIPRHVGNILSSLNGRLGSALAIGVGTGYDIDLLKEHGCNDITVLDISRRMLDVAADRHPDVPQIHADIMDDNSLSRRFDLILCIGVLEFVGDTGKLLARCASLLNLGGLLVITYEPVIKGYKPQAVSTQLIHSREQDPIYDCDGVHIHRDELGDFTESCSRAGLSILTHSLALAYIDEDSIFYGLATLRRKP
ncbi:MAG: class I SAM-dependent methyltransferase [Pseudomonadota bacterium]|uniref:class I SAM-dependent DNA methyltransferase n=1 Tax=Sphingomonas sp. ERG5 TaxID=1381597 RepID=UPI001364DA5F|nr:class I SAM-dependent methyltransferase [Sphingomonas sp. ERG5]